MKKITMLLVACFLVLSPSIALAEDFNREAFDYTNINEWHEQGYTGKGVKILLSDIGYVWEQYEGFDEKVKVINSGNFSQIPTNDHGMYSAQLLHLIAPDAEIYVTQFPSVIEAIDNDYQIVSSANVLPFDSLKKREKQFQQAYEKGIFMNNAIGNYADDSFNPWALSPYWWSTGAVDINKGVLKRMDYSSISEHLKSVSLTNLKIKYFENGKGYDIPYTGTSGASQVLSGMVALYYQYYKEQNGYFPSVDEVRRFIIDNSLDLEEEGHDQYTGHGLFVLPKITEEDNKCEIVTEESNELAVEMIQTDGEIRYVHIDFVDEYINDYGYALSKCKTDTTY